MHHVGAKQANNSYERMPHLSYAQTNHLEQYFKEVQNATPIDDLMRNEWARYSSFKSCPASSPALPSNLAKAGFYFIGPNDQVRCFSCKRLHSGWRFDDKPIVIHKNLSPQCRFLQEAESGNVPIHTETSERNTPIEDSTFGHRNDTRAADLNEDGYYGNATDCFPGDTTENQEPLEEECKHPQYKERAVRLSSYSNWRYKDIQDPQNLVEAGFFFAGFGDCVRCYYCGLGLRNWQNGDGPWIEHARWSADCLYLKTKKDFDFIERYRENKIETSLSSGARANIDVSNEKDEIKKEITKTASQKQDKADACSETTGNDSAEELSKQHLDMGFDRKAVENAVRSKTDIGHPCSRSEMLDTILSISNLPKGTFENATPQSQTGSTTVRANGTGVSESFVDRVFRPQKKEHSISSYDNTLSIDGLQDENRRLKDHLICKICMDREACVVFLPCGHMISCETCSPALLRCGVCRKLVKQKVKAFPY